MDESSDSSQGSWDLDSDNIDVKNDETQVPFALDAANSLNLNNEEEKETEPLTTTVFVSDFSSTNFVPTADTSFKTLPFSITLY